MSRGDYIDGTWIQPAAGATIQSIDPSTAGEVVCETSFDPGHVDLAMAAATDAARSWRAVPQADRLEALRRFAAELAARMQPIADAIAREIGKPMREALGEAASLAARIDACARIQLPRIADYALAGGDGECRYHPLGVVGVIGPFNYPLHLLHAHVVPALATGNAVVIKPSERALLSAERYIEAWDAAGLPPVLSMVQGDGSVGRALVDDERLGGLAFTGSWHVGRAIRNALVDRPGVLLALEMGGRNSAVVLPDADLDQALEGVLLGGYLSAGQRCTCTAQVLVHEDIAEPFLQRLVAAAARIEHGPPGADAFMGPMASTADRDRVDALCAAGVEGGAEVLLAAKSEAVGAFRSASVHRIGLDHDSDYTREEVFGPDLAVATVASLGEAVDFIAASPYGLSLALFSRDRDNLERVFRDTRVGCVNWNRSTNRASGALPFGGVGQSGNFRPAGADSARNTTYPVALLSAPLGKLEGDPRLQPALLAADVVAVLEARHRIEEICEPYAVYPRVTPEGTVSVPVEQLGPELSEALARALRELDVPASTVDGTLRFDGATPSGAASIASRLEQALYSLREIHPARFLSRRSPGARVPVGDGTGLSLPRSEAAMASLVGGEFVPDDKKPPVLDLFRSTGPYLASVDDDPLVLLDAAAQIATHAGGLNPPPLLEALWTGRFGDRPIHNPDTRRQPAPELARLAARLRRAVGPALPHVAFCGSGAEANELALRAAARQRPGRTRLVAFRGAFHGRTMAVLHATWNPAKRERFELAGFEARWCPWPARDPARPQPAADDLAGWDTRAGAESRVLAPDADASEREEHESLVAVEAALADDTVVAVLAEPMQSEGGEAHATGRFFVRLRALAAAYGVPFICDEVQTGFGLGGPFFWHRRFPLTSPPDLVTIAKKAQVGGVLSRWPISSPSEAHVTSVIRGELQAEIIEAGDVETLEASVSERLDALAAAYPDTVLAPRHEGWSFGFDLPTAEARNHLVQQRLWRGWMLYGAGNRAVRFRLHPYIDTAALEGLFARLDASISSLEAGEDTGWRQLAPPDEARSWPPRAASVADGYEIAPLDAERWISARAEVRQLQVDCYEAARRDDLELFTALMQDPEAVCFTARDAAGTLVGTAFGFPLEHFPALDGPCHDPELGRASTLYSADVTVHHAHRGKGLGVALKDAQLAEAMRRQHGDGSARYHFVTGRNRVGATAEMRAINERFGGYEVRRYSHQYGEPDGEAIYYRIPLCAPRLVRPSAPPRPPAVLDLDGATERRLRPHTRSGQELVAPWRAGVLNGAIVNKLSLCNFVTPGIVRAFEMLRATAPAGLGHLVLASSRAEVCDKGLRALKYHRGAARRVVSVGPVYAGETTAAARSVSLAADEPENFFGWPTTTDPTVDPDAALRELTAEIETHGAHEILAVVIEPVYLSTGQAVPDSFWQPLRALTASHGIPVVLLETTSGAWRNGHAMWRADTLPVDVDAVWYFAGGQAGLVFLSDALHVPEKLTLISTWDGDEVSLTRFCWELRAARALPLSGVSDRLTHALAPLGDVDGSGLYLSVACAAPDEVVTALRRHGVQAGVTANGRLRIAPPLDLTEAELEQLETAVARAANQEGA